MSMNGLVPLNPLRAFEVAARLKSLTRAAAELNVTQVAVSRQVRVLEDYLNVSLFARGHRSIKLTAEGAQLFSAITGAFSDIDTAIAHTSLRGRRNALSIRAYTTFAQKWLIPRLARFHEQHPSIEVFLSASTQPVDFERNHIDAAITVRDAHAAQPDETADFIAPMELLPVCSPAFLERIGGRLDLDQLRGKTLLHSLARPNAWWDWLAAAGAKPMAQGEGMKFQTSAMAYDAAMQGIGIAIGVRCLVQADIALGRLVAPFAFVHTLPISYHLVCPTARAGLAPLAKFRAWIQAEAELYRAEQDVAEARAA